MSSRRPFSNPLRVLVFVVVLLLIIASLIWVALDSLGGDAPSASNTTNSSEGSSNSATSSSARPSEKKPKKDGKREDEDDPSVVPGPVGGTGSFNMDGPAPVQDATFDSMPYALPLNPAGPQRRRCC